MAKAERAVNASPGLLILPDGTSIPPGGEFSLTKDLAANRGVQSWFEDGLASVVGADQQAEPAAQE